MQHKEQQGLVPAVSRHLFSHYVRKGQMEPDIQVAQDAMYKDAPDGYGDLPPVSNDNPQSITDYVGMADQWFGSTSDHEVYKDSVQWCDTRDEKIPAKYGNDVEGRVLIHTPKSIKGTKGNVAFIDCHGGGCIGGSPDQNKAFCSFMALNNCAIVFNVKYRLTTTGVSADQMAGDVVALIKWIREKAMFLGVDPNKICLHGCSGGGYVVGATCSKLALANEGHLVKLAMLNSASDPGFYIANDKSQMPRHVRDGAFCTPFIAHAYATDFEQQWAEKDPVLFPQQAADEVLQKWPVTMCISAEWDSYVESNDILAGRLAKNGRLVENLVYPGADHGFFYNQDYKMSKQFWSDLKHAVATYVTKIN